VCRLVGWVSRAPVTLAEVLGEAGLAELCELSRHHADGWGIAWWEGQRLRTQTSHLPAYDSAEFAAATRGVRSDAVLVHLRWATAGIPVAPENTHPFVVDGAWAFGHNGAVRPVEGILELLTDPQITALQGGTDSERLLHVLLARIRAYDLEEGLRRTVADVCRELTPSSLNSLLLGRDELTAVCCHGTPEPPVLGGPPEDQPGYFDLRWRQRDDGTVVVASEPLGTQEWQRVANGTALVVGRGTPAARTVQVGTFPPAALERERSRREAAAALRAVTAAQSAERMIDP
jgi:predicted glutamine amidotransferase